MRQRIKNILRWTNVLLVVVTLFAYLSPTIDPRSFWYFSILGLIFPLLFFAHLFFILLWAAFRKWNFLLSLFCLLIGWNALVHSIGLFNSSTKIETATESLQILTHNIMNGQAAVSNQQEAATIVANFINKQDADLVCLQEFFASKAPVRQFLNTLNKAYKYHHPTNQRQFIASKYPIIHTGELAAVNQSNGCIFADLDVNGQRIRVYNMHLLSNEVTHLADEVAQTGDLQNKKTWWNVGNMFRSYKRAAQRRATQATEIAAHIAQCPYPVIVCGDFNDVPLSFTYRTVSEGLQDSFRKKGSGFGTTFAGNIPLLRIDYILTSPTFDLFSHEVLRPSRNYSDHYPVRAEVTLRE